eukprot:3333459-Prymnesium_polylepis.1
MCNVRPSSSFSARRTNPALHLVCLSRAVCWSLQARFFVPNVRCNLPESCGTQCLSTALTSQLACDLERIQRSCFDNCAEALLIAHGGVHFSIRRGGREDRASASAPRGRPILQWQCRLRARMPIRRVLFKNKKLTVADSKKKDVPTRAILVAEDVFV